MKRIGKGAILIIAGLGLSGAVEAQNKVTAENHRLPKKIYVNDKGQIFVWNKAKLYLNLSTSPDGGEEAVPLRAKGARQATALAINGHGSHSIQQNKKQSKKTVPVGPVFPLFSDAKSPQSELMISRAPKIDLGKRTVYGRPVKMSLTFRDGDSGLQAGYYSLNNEAPLPYEGPILLDQEQNYQLKYYAFDNVGNKSMIAQKNVSLDFTPPVTKHHVLGNRKDNIVSSRARIKLVSRDEKAGVHNILYRLQGKRGAYSNAISLKDLPDGDYTLDYSAVDRVENVEENHSFSFYLDSAPPEVSYQIVGDQFSINRETFISSRSKIGLSATDNKAGVRRIRYYLKKGKGLVYKAPFQLPAKNGYAKFTYAASDLVGNISPLMRRNLVVDVSAPTVDVKFQGAKYFTRDTYYLGKTSKITFQSSDNLSGVKKFTYNVDAAGELTSKTPVSFVTAGKHSINVIASDNVNNEVQSSYEFFLDNQSPKLFPRFSTRATVEGDANGNGAVYPLNTKLYLPATDEDSGIQSIRYQINQGQAQEYDASLKFSKVGVYNIQITAKDNVGNMASQSLLITIK